MFVFVSKNSGVRSLIYIVGLCTMFGTIFWLWPFLNNGQNQSQIHTTLFAALATPLFLIGFSCVLIPALIGKAALFNAICQASLFLSVSNLSAAMSLIGPLICLWYYLSSGHTLEFSWYTSQYYFDSNTLFTFLVAILGACLSEKPIHSLINLRKDIKRADLDERNSIAAFESTIASHLG